VNPSETEILAKEICLRSDFEREAVRMTHRLVDAPSSGVRDAAEAWIGVLRQQKSISQTAALELDEIDHSVRPLAYAEDKHGFWDRFINSPMVERASRCLRERTTMSMPLTDSAEHSFFVMCPCLGTHPKLAIASVAQLAEDVRLVHWMNDTAAIRLASQASLIELANTRVQEAELRAQIAEAQSRGYREMASRMSHVIAGSVFAARMHVESILNREFSIPQEITRRATRAFTALQQVEDGLGRARLLDIPWCRYGKAIELSSFLEKRLAELTDAIGSAKEPFSWQLPTEPLTVYAAPHRLYYAFRDLFLGVWMLKCKDPGSPANVTIDRAGAYARVCVEAPINGRVGGVPTDKLLAVLDDPETFLSSAEEPLERGISFHLARRLIEEIETDCGAELRRGQLEIEDKRDPETNTPTQLRVIVKLPCD
jgi:hypothetical protein